jgi:hypothetical protein
MRKNIMARAPDDVESAKCNRIHAAARGGTDCARGGRVYAADGTEITLATEAEYDRKVRRVQLKSNWARRR